MLKVVSVRNLCGRIELVSAATFRSRVPEHTNTDINQERVACGLETRSNYFI